MDKSDLGSVLQEYTADAGEALCESAADGKVRCLACAHQCLIAPGGTGVCKVRFNRDGRLRVPHGYVAGLQCDPIEKKPFFHVLPGSNALSFGMLGCNFHCDFCQNWVSSQTLRDPRALASFSPITSQEIVSQARRSGASAVVSTYNEPLITTEWAVEVFTQAKALGMRCGYVSNGHASLRVIEHLRPVIDMFKVDLKCFREDKYHRLGGKLQAVTDTIVALKERDIWVEVVTLIVPDFSDDPAELGEIAHFLAGVSTDIPWHVTAFYPTYKMTDRSGTHANQLMTAINIGREAGLRYVYAGNLPGRVRENENTRCPSCNELLVERHGYMVTLDQLRGSGACPKCHTSVPGIWS